LAAQSDLPGRRLELTRDQVEIGGLAGAVWADDGGQRTGPEGTADGVDRNMAAEADRQVTRFQAGCQAHHRNRNGRGRCVPGRPCQRLLRIGSGMSCGEITWISSSRSFSSLPSFLTRK